LLERLTAWPKGIQSATIVAVMLFVGYLDYITGPHISMSAFYLLPLTLAAWSISLRFALFIAAACVALWMGGNTINGDVDFLSVPLALWNGGVQLVSFVVLAITVSRLSALQRELESRVRDRTAALERTQHDLLRIGEREQRRIGQDLHDGLCQHLAGTAYTCQALQEELAQRGIPEAKNAQHVVDLIKEGIALSRESAKGLDPVELNAEGLMQALDESASATSKLFRVSCRFECDSPVHIHEGAVAAHLFRIAQEAVRNAINHGHASDILVALRIEEEGLELLVEDNGAGIANARPSGRGMGLVIMPRRAAIIGASFEITRQQGGGTRVRCFLPTGRIAKGSEYEQQAI
jgi:signal transduction histidine kinase